MKKYSIIIAFVFVSAKLFAQMPSTADLVRAMRGARTSIEADKSILSAGEVAQLNVDIFVPPIIDPKTAEPINEGRNIKASDAAQAVASAGIPFIYHTKNWKILQGGGSIDILDDFNIRYTAPAQAPRDNIMVISVELIPTSPSLPKVILIKTLYFQNGDNVFAFNVPASGINDDRYGQQTTGAKASPTNPSTVAAIDPAILARIPAAEREKLQKQKNQVDAAVQASNINVVSLTSNANAIFDPQNNVTIMKFIGLRRITGSNSQGTPDGGIFIITYTGGLTKGIHPFNGTSNAILFRPGAILKTCVCSMQGNKTLQQLKCGGTLTITSMDGDFITGTISTTVWNNKTGSDQYFNRGTVYGVFKVRKAY